MLLIIDNYDSFTYNLVHYFYSLGQDIKIITNDALDVAAMASLNPSRLVISPGPKGPEEAGNSLAAIAYFYNKIPILGVCLGHQCLAHHFGGSIIQAKNIMHGKVSAISHKQQGLFHNIPNPFHATRYHSLAVDATKLPECLIIDAWTEDEIMALRHQNLPLFGVQFHPESILTEYGLLLLRNFINAH